MKIGIDCRIYSSKFTGIGRYTHELVKNFIRLNDEEKRHHEIVLFFNNPEFKKYIPQNPAVKKVLVNAKHYSFSEQTKFLKILNKENCDIVHFPHFNVPIFYRKPYVVTIHDLTLSFYPGRKMTKLHHRIAYYITIKNAVKKSRRVIAVSENTKKDIISQLKVSGDKMEVIYNGVSEEFRLLADPKPATQTLKRYHIQKQFLLYTGVWRSHKNLPGLIKAFSILKKEKNLDLNLVITGKPDPHYPEPKQLTLEYGLADSVIFTGLVDEKELVHLYNAALIYVFPSFYEGFGLPPLESMKCGTPVVASNTSSIPEVCGEGNAVFFNPQDPSDIAGKIYQVYKDVDLQARLIENGIRHACRFSWEESAQKTFNLIKRVTKNV
jgi:glycosyltransferase involved in cell wall biosynthesis